MNNFNVYDDTGNERIIPEEQMYKHFRLFLGPVLTEVGLTPDAIAKHNGHIYQLIGCVVAGIREKNSRLDIARKEFKKIRAEKDEHYALMMRFMKMMCPEKTVENLIQLEDRRKAA